MIKRSNAKYVEGTAARKLVKETGDTLIVSYNEGLERYRDVHRKSFAQRNYARFEITRSLLGPQSTISKAQYLFGMAFCFAGGLLVFALGLLF